MTVTTFQRKATPTNADLQDRVAEVHGCIHKVGEDVKTLAETVRKDRHDSNNRDMILDTRLARLEGSTDAMVRYFGIRPGEPEKERKTIGGLEWWQAIVGGIGALSAYKIAWAALAAAHHALLTAH